MKYAGWIKRGVAWVVCMVLVLGSLSGCGAEENLTIRAALSGTVATLDPALATTDAERTALLHLRDNLMKLTSDSEGGVSAVCAVAKSYQCKDNDDGSQTYTFTLRDDALWSDGKVVTAGDFVYAWQHLVDPDTASPYAALLNMVSGYSKARSGKLSALKVSAKDDHTLRVVLAHRCPYFLAAVCTSPATMPLRQDDPALTNGAYCLSEQTEDLLTMTASKDYYDAKRRGPDTLHFALCPSPADTLAQFESEKYDAALGLTETPGELAVAVAYPEVGTLLVNQMAENMDKALRRALSLSIDRQALAEKLGGGYTPAEGLVPGGILNTQGTDFRADCGALIDTVAEDYEKNCETAREVLAQAGYSTRTLAAMDPLYVIYENDPALQSVAQALQETWQRELNVRVTMQALSAEDMAAALKKGEFTMALTRLRGEYTDAAGYLDTWRSGGAENWANFHSAAYDMLLQIADASQSAEARDAYLKDAEGLLLDKGYVIPLYFTFRTRQVRGNLSGLLSDGLGAYYLGYLHKGA